MSDEREVHRQISESEPQQGLVEWLNSLEPLEDDFPPIADPPPSPR